MAMGSDRYPGQLLGVVFQHVQKAAEAVAGDDAVHILGQLSQVPRRVDDSWMAPLRVVPVDRMAS